MFGVKEAAAGLSLNWGIDELLSCKLPRSLPAVSVMGSASKLIGGWTLGSSAYLHPARSPLWRTLGLRRDRLPTILLRHLRDPHSVRTARVTAHWQLSLTAGLRKRLICMQSWQIGCLSCGQGRALNHRSALAHGDLEDSQGWLLGPDEGL